MESETGGRIQQGKWVCRIGCYKGGGGVTVYL